MEGLSFWTERMALERLRSGDGYLRFLSEVFKMRCYGLFVRSALGALLPLLHFVVICIIIVLKTFI